MSVASPPPRARGPSDADLDLSALGSTLWRKKWTVLRPTILVAVAAFLVVQVITPRYQPGQYLFASRRR
jgi:LPS O-antigen subunit length determinant protein (WzzB/FepE family)